MPQHKSALKRVRQAERRRLRNRVRRTKMRSMIKKLRDTSNPAEATTLLASVKSYLDRLAVKGIIHKNMA
ncbi:MAG: 30S ribosomal protein S20, partial [Bacteroidetes bacterium]|nr:30S ribosomal protein S20 [Bacteroidota bacterium]